MGDLSRRRFVAGTTSALSAAALAGCTESGDPENPPFTAIFGFKTAIDPNTGDPIRVPKLFTGQCAAADHSRELLFLPEEKREPSTDAMPYVGDTDYWVRLPFFFEFLSPNPASDIGRVEFQLDASPISCYEPTMVENRSKSHQFSEEDIRVDLGDGFEGSYAAMDSTNSSDAQGADLGSVMDLTVKFDKTGTQWTYANLGFRLDFRLEFPDVDAYDPMTATVDAGVPNHDNEELQTLLNAADIVWSQTKSEVGNPLYDLAYEGTKLTTAGLSGKYDADLVQGALANDVGAFADRVGDDRYDVTEDREYEVGSAGMIFSYLPQEATETEDDGLGFFDTPEVDGEDVHLTDVFGDGRYPVGVRVEHLPSSGTTFSVDAMDLELSGTNADGVYHLEDAVETELSEPGDDHDLTTDDLGRDDAFETDGFTVTLFYETDGERYKTEKLEVWGLESD